MIKLTTDKPDLTDAQWFREATKGVPNIIRAASKPRKYNPHAKHLTTCAMIKMEGIRHS